MSHSLTHSNCHNVVLARQLIPLCLSTKWWYIHIIFMLTWARVCKSINPNQSIQVLRVSSLTSTYMTLLHHDKWIWIDEGRVRRDRILYHQLHVLQWRMIIPHYKQWHEMKNKVKEKIRCTGEWERHCFFITFLHVQYKDGWWWIDGGKLSRWWSLIMCPYKREWKGDEFATQGWTWETSQV